MPKTKSHPSIQIIARVYFLLWISARTLSRVDSSVDLTLVYKNDNILLSTMLKKIENDYIQLKVFNIHF